MNILSSILTVGFLILVVTGIIYFLPTGEFPTEAHDAIVITWGYLKSWTYFLNLGQFFIVLTLIVFTEGAIFAFKGLFWLYNLIFKRNN